MIAASAGNHAQGIAYHAKLLGIPTTVVMPVFAALIKVTNCRQFGADVVLHGADLTEARAHAGEIAAREGLTFIHPFDNVDVIAGQGTMGLEILEQTPDVEAIVVPVGGGGLIAGIGTAVKAKAPGVEIVGVEPDRAACLTEALAQDAPTTVPLSHTLADGLAVGKLGDAPFAIVKRVVDRVVTVDEAMIALAILRLIELEKSVVEGAGAAPLAAFLAGRLDMLEGQAGRAGTGRRQHRFLGARAHHRRRASSPMAGSAAFTVTISDRPGGLARLAEIIAAAGASIKEIVHDRAFAGPDLSAVRVVCVAETTGHAHVERLHRGLARGRASGRRAVVAASFSPWPRRRRFTTWSNTRSRAMHPSPASRGACWRARLRRRSAHATGSRHEAHAVIAAFLARPRSPGASPRSR